MLIILTSLMTAALVYVIDRNWYNPVCVFSILWLVLTLLYGLQLFGIKSARESTFSIVLVGLISFVVGYLFSMIFRKRQTAAFGIRVDCISAGANQNLLKVAVSIVAIYYIFEALMILRLLSSGVSLFDIRTAFQGYASYSFSDVLLSLRSGALYSWFIIPLYNTCVVLAAINLFYGRRDPYVILASLFCVLVRTLFEGSRFAIYNLAIFVFFSFLISKKKIVISRKTKKVLVGVIALGVVLVLAVTVTRISSGEKTIAEELYMYMTCCFPLLDFWTNSSLPMTNGSTSFYGVLQPFAIVLQNLGFDTSWYTAGADNIARFESFVPIRHRGYSDNWNAFISAFGYLYVDGGWVGVVLGMSALGLVSGLIYSKMQGLSFENGRNTYVRWLALYLMILEFVMMTMVRCSFSVASFSITFIYILIFTSTFTAKRCRSSYDVLHH